ncbi:MAG: hypothetical protein HY788_00525 [Deltaproteobacteria bacterium]|nr:hypothetical protein [Deltaproteobacteria bacterium]
MRCTKLLNVGIRYRLQVWALLAAAAVVLALAMCPKEALCGSLSKDVPSLAIFPFYLPGVTETRAPFFVAALYDVLEESKAFIPKYSWYPGDDRFRPDSMRPLIGLKDLSKRIWKQTENDPKKGPDREVVFKVGEQLGVDAVILYAFHVSGYGNDLVEGYLFDVIRKRVFVEKRDGKMVYVFTGEILETALAEWIHDITRQLFRMED